MAGTPTFDIASAVTGATGEITSQVSAVLPQALLVGGGLLAVGIAWRQIRKFVRG